MVGQPRQHHIKSPIRLGLEALCLGLVSSACLPGEDQLGDIIAACNGLTLEEIREYNELTPECREAIQEFLAYTQTNFGTSLVRAGKATEPATGRALLYLFGSRSGTALTAADYAGFSVTAIENGIETPLSPSEFEFIPLAGSIDSLISLSVVIDYSGSMLDTDLDTAESIFTGLFAVLPGVYSAETIYFSENVTQKQPFTGNTGSIANSVRRDNTYTRSSTALYDALGTALTHLETRSTPIRLLIVATDGQENSSKNWTLSQVESRLDSTRTVPIVVASLFSDISVIGRITQGRGAYFYGRSFVEARNLLGRLYTSIEEMHALAIDSAHSGAQRVRITSPAGGSWELGL